MSYPRSNLGSVGTTGPLTHGTRHSLRPTTSTPTTQQRPHVAKSTGPLTHASRQRGDPSSEQDTSEGYKQMLQTKSYASIRLAGVKRLDQNDTVSPKPTADLIGRRRGCPSGFGSPLLPPPNRSSTPSFLGCVGFQKSMRLSLIHI